MGLPVYEHTLTVSDTTVTPQGPFDCGTAGDESAARLRFCFEAADAADYEYRLEAVAGDGAYDITDRLPLTDGVLSFDIPSPWTAAGVAAVRLVRYRRADGVLQARQYYPPILLQFAYRDEGTLPITAPLQWQELITRAEAVLNEAAEAAEIASMTAEEAQRSLAAVKAAGTAAVEDAREAAVHAEGAAADCAEVRDEVEALSGIAADILAMTGTGGGIYHPCVTVDTALDGASDNPVANSAVTAALSDKADSAHVHMASDVYLTLGEDDPPETLCDRLDSIESNAVDWSAMTDNSIRSTAIAGANTVYAALVQLFNTKASTSSLSAENIAFEYNENIRTVADALTVLLDKAFG